MPLAFVEFCPALKRMVKTKSNPLRNMAIRKALESDFFFAGNPNTTDS
jgi:hypothetical protein